MSKAIPVIVKITCGLLLLQQEMFAAYLLCVLLMKNYIALLNKI